MSRKHNLTLTLLSCLLLLVITACVTPSQSSGLVPLEPAPALGVTINADAVVVDVEPGSSADKAGIQRGDVLQKVGSVALATPELRADPGKAREARMEIKLMLMNMQAGSRLDVKLRRNGSDVVLSVELIPPPTRPGQPTATPVVEPSFYL
ncbi:MAG: PDZ domain-containing protein [Anaerolineae bacterium]|nr:S1C family serine protease [Candidatus Roseilinea sp.]MDW8450390.1 PDZ domain-containing protein [Anaerolineae bacterium]